MKIIHISDLHFGREGKNLLPAFQKIMEEINPDLVVVSGDFTQDARIAEFKRAQSFLEALPCKFFCVPGNHDIPNSKLWERFLTPYRRYKTFISKDLCPIMEFPDAVFAGLNSARRMLPHWNWANGAISDAQLRRVKKIYGEHETRWRVCVFHHPIHKIEEAPIDITVFGARRALHELSAMRVDLVLTGHLHHASISVLGDEHRTVYVSASTALSTRLRAQENGFNIIYLEPTLMRIAVYKYRRNIFVRDGEFDYPRQTAL
jgi:3',5'-cyclic AMP phosphodiesterase CpdA